MKIMVADDETIIRKGLIRLIEDMGEGYEIVGEASNGEEVLALLPQYNPHVVVVDIRMPKLDGLQLIERLDQTHPEVKKIIISGFAEFTYARKAISHGVIDYLLKPIDEDHLREALKKVSEICRREAVRQRAERETETALRESREKEKALFVLELVRDNEHRDAERAADALRRLGCPADLDLFRAVCVHIDNFRSRNPLDRRAKEAGGALLAKTARALSDFPLYMACQEPPGSIVLVGAYREDAAVLARAVEALRRALAEEDLPVSLLVTDEVSDLSRIPSQITSLETALDAYCFRRGFFYLDGCAPLPTVRNEHAVSEKTRPLVQAALGQFLSVLGRNDFQRLGAVLKEFVRRLEGVGVTRTGAVQAFSDLFSGILREYPALTPSLLCAYGQDFSYYRQADLFETADGLLSYTVGIMEMLFLQSGRCTAGREKKIVTIIKEYIDAHYREKLTLNSIADVAFVSPNYICELFRSQLGEHFLDYLTRIRLEKAKELLRNKAIKVFQVGELVGYEDPTYFSKVFKKNIGVSPNEYRNMAIH